MNEHAVAAVAVRHPSPVAEQLLAPVAAAFAGTGEATFAGVGAVDVARSEVTRFGRSLVCPTARVLDLLGIDQDTAA